jgi:hypothetical protein
VLESLLERRRAARGESVNRDSPTGVSQPCCTVYLDLAGEEVVRVGERSVTSETPLETLAVSEISLPEACWAVWRLSLSIRAAFPTPPSA